MGLINAQPARALRSRMLPGVGRGRLPVLGGEGVVRLLDDAAGIGGNAVQRAVRGDHMDLDPAAMEETLPIEGIGQEDGPDAPLVARQRIGLAIPAIEVADQRQGLSAGRPLAIPDAGLALLLAPVQAEPMVPLADRTQ